MAEHAYPVQPVKKEDDSDAIHQERKEDVNIETVQGSLALEIARRTHPPNPWSIQMRKLYVFLAVAYLCSALNGKKEIFHSEYKMYH